jgi:hypothetical protein
MLKYLILFFLPLNISHALTPKECLKKYTRRKFQLVVHMTMAHKKKDFVKFADTQSEYRGIGQAEKILKELSQGKPGKHTQDLYLMLKDQKNPKQIDSILKHFLTNSLFCYTEGKGTGLLTYDDLVGLIKMVKGP